MLPIGRGGGLGAVAGQGGELAAGHAIDAVVHDNGRHVDIAPGGVDEMVPADGQGIAVAHGNDDVQFGPAQFDAGGKGQGTAVNGMQGVKIHIPGNP